MGARLMRLAQSRRTVGICATAPPFALSMRGPHAQSPSAANLNYVYAANLGFGGYSLAGLTANVFTLPLGYTFPVSPGQAGDLG